jgi:hypothetical protein
MTTIEVYRPTPERSARSAAGTPAPRGVDPATATLLLVCNTKPKAYEVLTFLGEELRALLGVAAVEVHRKPAASSLLDAEFVEARSDGATLVVAGVGDCGSCSACSLHDAVQFEQRGTPAAMITTEAFEQHVASFAETFGMPGYPAVAIPHPVSTRGDDELRAIAAAVAPLVAARLAGNGEGGAR